MLNLFTYINKNIRGTVRQKIVKDIFSDTYKGNIPFYFRMQFGCNRPNLNMDFPKWILATRAMPFAMYALSNGRIFSRLESRIIALYI